ncbi:hypothetical protein SBA4_3890003 [Candidatus Sulfopaludibacter sp. SbA4]|nr:hypothetical protein SBA4_3890003 [Candidatus Sulfopaludibacter sp. SbA4]
MWDELFLVVGGSFRMGHCEQESEVTICRRVPDCPAGHRSSPAGHESDARADRRTLS